MRSIYLKIFNDTAIRVGYVDTTGIPFAQQVVSPQHSQVCIACLAFAYYCNPDITRASPARRPLRPLPPEGSSSPFRTETKMSNGARERATTSRRSRNNASPPSADPPPRLSIPDEPPKVPRRPPSKGNKRETLADIAKRIPVQLMRQYFNYPLRSAAEVRDKQKRERKMMP